MEWAVHIITKVVALIESLQKDAMTLYVSVDLLTVPIKIVSIERNFSTNYVFLASHASKNRKHQAEES